MLNNSVLSVAQPAPERPMLPSGDVYTLNAPPSFAWRKYWEFRAPEHIGQARDANHARQLAGEIEMEALYWFDASYPGVMEADPQYWATLEGPVRFAANTALSAWLTARGYTGNGVADQLKNAGLYVGETRTVVNEEHARAQAAEAERNRLAAVALEQARDAARSAELAREGEAVRTQQIRDHLTQQVGLGALFPAEDSATVLVQFVGPVTVAELERVWGRRLPRVGGQLSATVLREPLVVPPAEPVGTGALPGLSGTLPSTRFEAMGDLVAIGKPRVARPEIALQPATPVERATVTAAAASKSNTRNMLVVGVAAVLALFFMFRS